MKNNGFLSIELLFVIVILFFLGATIAPQFIDIKKETKITVAKSIEKIVAFVIGQDKTYSIAEEDACQILYYKANENRKQPIIIKQINGC